jgi:hypothetical protein
MHCRIAPLGAPRNGAAFDIAEHDGSILPCAESKYRLARSVRNQKRNEETDKAGPFTAKIAQWLKSVPAKNGHHTTIAKIALPIDRRNIAIEQKKVPACRCMCSPSQNDVSHWQR